MIGRLLLPCLRYDDGRSTENCHWGLDVPGAMSPAQYGPCSGTLRLPAYWW